MLTHTPVPLSQPDLISVAEFLSHQGRAILEKTIRGQIASYINKATDITLRAPMDVLAKGPEDPRAREMNIKAAKLQIFLDVLADVSRPETNFEMSRFEVE